MLTSVGDFPDAWRRAWQEEDDRWGLFFPVLVGWGIYCYFSLSCEPPLWFFSILVVIGCGVALVTLFYDVGWKRRIGWGLFAVILGFTSSFFETQSKGTPMLDHEIGPLALYGTVVGIERIASKKPEQSSFAWRFTLGDLSAPHHTPSILPYTVRLTWRGAFEPKIVLGSRVAFRAVLRPLGGPVIPRGYDFRQDGFFKGLGAVGFMLTPPSMVSPPHTDSCHLFFQRIRRTLNLAFYKGLSSPVGSVATALVTGETTGLPRSLRQSFADAGIAHVLAISGLHLSIVTGLFFLLIQGILALFPWFALRYPLHKIAAIGALCGAACYLVISNSAVPTQRAFIMVSMVMAAVLMDRHPLSLRTIAFAATCVLLWSPHVLMGPSFQLSFAAVIALVAAFEKFAPKIERSRARSHGFFARGGIYFFSSLMSTLVATCATTPYADLTFHRFTLQAILANLIVIPWTTFCVMPLLVLACFAIPFGGERLIFPLLDPALSFLVDVAAEISSWPGAFMPVPQAPFEVWFCLTMGGVWLCLWKTWIRLGGFLFFSVGCLLMYWAPQPHVLVDGRGKVSGFFEHATSTLWVSSLRKGRFVTEKWAEALAAKAIKQFPYTHATPPFLCDKRGCRVDIPHGGSVFFCLSGCSVCSDVDLIVSLKKLLECKGTTVIDRQSLACKGAMTVTFREGRLSFSYAASTHRPWSMTKK